VIEAGVIQASSRALYEEVLFDKANVRSVDWQTYPIVEMQDAPESFEVVLLNRPDEPPQGAGEACCRPVAGAIANAVFDATGVRLRSVPYTPEKVKAAMRTGA
jgi:CO/xanthine dehydrogenase Mo-binding subunit